MPVSSVSAVNPFEFLRYVARTHGADPVELALGAADALSAVTHDPGALMVSARRLLEHQPTNAPLWNVSARAVTALDARSELRERMRELREDPTALHLADALPEGAVVCTIGWSGHIVDALQRRGDVRALVVDSLGDGQDTLRQLSRNDCDCELVAPEGLASAVEAADVTLVHAAAVGDTDVLACGGTLALASVAWCTGRPVWMVASAATRLPAALFDPMVEEVRGRPDPWASGFDLVPHGLVGAVFSPAGGPLGAGALAAQEACPPATELLRRSVV